MKDQNYKYVITGYHHWKQCCSSSGWLKISLLVICKLCPKWPGVHLTRSILLFLDAQNRQEQTKCKDTCNFVKQSFVLCMSTNAHHMFCYYVYHIWPNKCCGVYLLKQGLNPINVKEKKFRCLLDSNPGSSAFHWPKLTVSADSTISSHCRTNLVL